MDNLLIMGAGLLFFAIGVYLLVKWVRFKSGAVKAKGIVIGHWGKPGKDGDYLYAPVVQFYDLSTGQLWTFKTPNYSSLKRRVGRSIAVVYRPEDPQQANIDTIGQILIPLLVMFMGSLALLLGSRHF